MSRQSGTLIIAVNEDPALGRIYARELKDTILREVQDDSLTIDQILDGGGDAPFFGRALAIDPSTLGARSSQRVVRGIERWLAYRTIASIDIQQRESGEMRSCARRVTCYDDTEIISAALALNTPMPEVISCRGEYPQDTGLR